MGDAKRRVLQVLLVLGLIGIGIVVMGRMGEINSPVDRQRPPVQPPAVRVVPTEVAVRPVLLRGEGTVRPLREIHLIPQVSGLALYVSPSLVDGGEYKRGETLLRIDPVDYQLAVTLTGAALKDAESALRLMEEEAAAAREEWKILHPGGEASRQPPPLVAKEPQLEAARARLAAAEADLRNALLRLERTVIQAPFSGRVSEKSVDQGQFVAAGQPLASLYSTEAVEIVVPLPDEDLFWFHVPGFTPGGGPGAEVLVKARIAGHDMTWPGRVVRAGGRLDERTRMINVVVRVDGPYERKPPLAPGLFVTVEIRGRDLPHAAVIPRSALRGQDTVWVVENDGRLRFREVDVAVVRGNTVWVRSGLSSGDSLVVSPLKAVTDGMAVQALERKEAESP